MEFEINLYQNEEFKIPFHLWITQIGQDIRLEYRDENSIPFITDLLNSFQSIAVPSNSENKLELNGVVSRKIEFKDSKGLTNFLSFLSKVVKMFPDSPFSFQLSPLKEQQSKDTKQYIPHDSIEFKDNVEYFFKFLAENDDEFMWHKSIPITTEDINNLLLSKSSHIAFSAFEFDAKSYQYLVTKCIIKSDLEQNFKKYLEIKDFWSKITKFQWNNNKNLRTYVQEVEGSLQQCNIKSNVTKEIIFNVLISCMYFLSW